MWHRNSDKSTAMPPATLLFMAAQNLLAKKLRSVLTIAGISIGIGAIFFLLSLGLGLRNLVTEEILGDRSVKSIDVTSPNSRTVKIDQAMLGRMKNLGHTTSVGASFSFPAVVQLNNSAIDAVAYGTDEQYFSFLSLPIVAGRAIQRADGQVVLLNRAALRAMGVNDDQAMIGKKLRLKIPLKSATAQLPEVDSEFTVLGITDSGSGSEVYLPNFVFENAGVPYYSQAKLMVDENVNVRTVRSQVESFGLETSSPIDTIEQINQIFRFFTLVLLGFGAIGMTVAILGMFNTLTVSLLERTPEIGLMRALGARALDVRRLFAVEALLLSLTGALAGIIGALVIGQAVNTLINLQARQRGVTENFSLFATPWWLQLALLAFMALIGLAVVYFPARRAARINPIDALRRE